MFFLFIFQQIKFILEKAPIVKLKLITLNIYSFTKRISEIEALKIRVLFYGLILLVSPKIKLEKAFLIGL